MKETTTIKLERLSYSELKELHKIVGELLRDRDSLHPRINTAGLRVVYHDAKQLYVVNNDCEIFMLNGERLEKEYSCRRCDMVGFLDELEGFDTKRWLCAACIKIYE